MLTDRIRVAKDRDGINAIMFMMLMLLMLVSAIFYSIDIVIPILFVAVVAAVLICAAAETALQRSFALLFSVTCVSVYFVLTGIPLWLTGISILAVGEVIFYFDKAKPKKNQSIFRFTAKRKLGCFGEAGLITVNTFALFHIIPLIVEYVTTNTEHIIYWFGVAGICIAAIASIIFAAAAYIWLNSLKYGNVKAKNVKELSR